MITLLNIGNSNCSVAAFDGSSIRLLHKVPTAEFSTGLLPPDQTVAAACVVPAIRQKLAGRPIFWLGSEPAAATGLDLSKVDTSTLGADRLANAIELVNRAVLPAAVFDFGTAITLEIVDGDKCFRGGAIAPGRRLLRRTLAVNTAQLPEIPWSETAPTRAGRNTVEAIQLGVDRGAVGMVRELIRTAENEFPGLKLYSTGGDAAFFERELPELEAGGELFTFAGLLAAYLGNH